MLNITKSENRILITCDHGFIDIPKFKQEDYFGIIYLDILDQNKHRIRHALTEIFENIDPTEIVGKRLH